MKKLFVAIICFHLLTTGFEFVSDGEIANNYSIEYGYEQ